MAEESEKGEILDIVENLVFYNMQYTVRIL